MNRVSIIILNYNTFDLTCKCIRSVYATNRSISELGIIVVDNGSTENVGTTFKEVFPEVKEVILSENLGFEKGNKVGLKLARNSYVILLNSDVIIQEENTSYRCITKIMRGSNNLVHLPALLTQEGQRENACV